jgi:hypothetical protein
MMRNSFLINEKYIEYIDDIRTYLKIKKSSSYRHPRAGGDPIKTMKYMDSRLRGNDARAKEALATRRQVLAWTFAPITEKG